MNRTAVVRGLSTLALATLIGCSEDMEPADPGGMGAGRPATAGSAETPAESVLDYANPSVITDTSAVVQDPTGAPDPAGTARDTSG